MLLSYRVFPAASPSFDLTASELGTATNSRSVVALVGTTRGLIRNGMGLVDVCLCSVRVNADSVLRSHRKHFNISNRTAM